MATPSPHRNSQKTIPADRPGGSKAVGDLPKDLANFISARIELASIEAREAAEFAAKKSLLGAMMTICALFTWGLILAGLVGVLAPTADNLLKGTLDNLPGWAAVLFALGLIHGLATLIIMTKFKKKPYIPLFYLSRKEFEHDKQWLTKHK